MHVWTWMEKVPGRTHAHLMCFLNGQIHSLLLLMGRKALEKLSPLCLSRECRMVESLSWEIMRAKSDGCHGWTHLIYINSHPPLERLYRTSKTPHRSPSTQAWLIPFKPSGLWPPCMVTEGVPASASIVMQWTLRPLPAPVSNALGWRIVCAPPHETFLLHRIHWLGKRDFFPLRYCCPLTMVSGAKELSLRHAFWDIHRPLTERS